MKTMDLKHKTKHVLVTGRSGSGKSTMAERFIRDESKQDIVFIFDPEFEFVNRFNKRESSNVSRLEDLGSDKLKRIRIYNPPEDADRAFEFDDFCEYCLHFGFNFDGGILVVFDELQEYVDADTLPESFKTMITRGRRYKIDMLYISQAPNLLHNIIRTQTTEAVAFAQADELPVKYNKALGFDGDEIMGLPELHYIRKQIGFPVERGVIKFE